MSRHSRATDSAVAQAAYRLRELQEETEQVLARLSHLRQDVLEAQSQLDACQAAQLLEANEQLLLATLRAQTDAEAARRALNDASRSAALDPLTGLPNRVLLLDRFGHAIASARRHGTRMALLFVDLDDFKQINDTLGHAAGDQVLKFAAHGLASSVREADTVSRYGGDEFVILLTEVSQLDAAARVAEKVLAALGKENRIGDRDLHVTASIGISLYPDDGEDADTLIDRADAAMYRVKRHAPGGFAFHADGGSSDRGEQPTSPESLS